MNSLTTRLQRRAFRREIRAWQRIQWWRLNPRRSRKRAKRRGYQSRAFVESNSNRDVLVQWSGGWAIFRGDIPELTRSFFEPYVLRPPARSDNGAIV